MCELLLLWGAYDSGGFQRHHSLPDLLFLGAFYLAIPLLWPVMLLVAVLQLVGILPTPIELRLF